MMFQIAEVSAESVLWLAHRLGPMLTSKYLTKNLLRMLPLCYTGDLLCEDKSTHVTNCLINIAGKFCFSLQVSSIFCCFLLAVNFLHFSLGIYGEQFVVLQYLPQIAELITVCKRSKMTQALEAGLIGYISFFKYVISFLTVDTLKNLMQVCVKSFYLM